MVKPIKIAETENTQDWKTRPLPIKREILVVKDSIGGVVYDIANSGLGRKGIGWTEKFRKFMLENQID